MRILDGWHARVLVDRQDSIILTLPSGDRQLQKFARHARFSLVVDAGGKATLTLDSFSLVPRSATDVATLEGARWSWQSGDLRVNAMHSSGGDAAASLNAVVRDLMPRWPSQGIKPRSMWSDSADGPLRVDVFDAQERRTGEWRTGSFAPHGSAEAVAVHLKEEFEQLGDGNQGGRKMSMTSQGRRSATYYVTPDGRISSAEIADSVAMLISIPSTKEVVPTMRYGRTTVRFVSESPGHSD